MPTIVDFPTVVKDELVVSAMCLTLNPPEATLPSI